MNEMSTQPGTGMDLSGMKANSPVALAFQSREMIECLGMMQMAKMDPRNPQEVRARLLQAAKNETLAVAAEYIYVKGGTEVTGLSIRAAEALAKAYKHIDFGMREISVTDKETVCQAYCWDMENNTRESEFFIVPHSRSKGVWDRGVRVGTEVQKITDQRELDEITRSRGSRIKRACILGVIPIDVQEEFAEACEKTLAAKIDKMIEVRSDDEGGIKKVIEDMLIALETKYHVTRQMVADRFQKKHNGDRDIATRLLYNLDNRQIIMLYRIVTGLRDGIATPADYFKGATDERIGTGPTGTTGNAHKSAKDSLKERLAAKSGPTGATSPADGKSTAPAKDGDKGRNSASGRTDLNAEDVI